MGFSILLPFLVSFRSEIDYMETASHSHKPSAVAIEMVKDAFKNAPVENPDGGPGITLHVLVDEAIVETWGNSPMTIWDTVREIKEAHFGTEFERTGNPNWPKTREAKKLVYRYALFGHTYKNPDGTESSSSGIAELPGDDFVVSLGKAAGEIGTVDQQAATLMHEMGHTLNLGHGGADSIHCKPNYLSIMNYSFQFPYLVPARPLDYSRQRLPTLVETNLSEVAGIGGPMWMTTIFGPAGPGGGVKTSTDGPVDWNEDGDWVDNGVARDINAVGWWCDSQSANETLVGHDDWQNIVYNFRGSPFFSSGAPPPDASVEITAEIRDAMLDASPGTVELPPVADAGAAFSVPEGANAVLNGAGSAQDGGISEFRWAQVSGPQVTLSSTSVANPSFTAPTVDANTEILLELAVRGVNRWSLPSVVKVTVLDRHLFSFAERSHTA